ncbi:aminoglycoside phosphotransferase family protein [soil metagenome]
MRDDLDIEQPGALVAYLRETNRIAADEEPGVTILAGGVSNRTMLVERESGESWVVKQALAKLRVQVDWFSDPARIHREADGLRWLGEISPPGTITPLIFEDRDDYILAMAAVPQPHENWKQMLLRGDLQIDHVEQFAALLGTIHRVSNERRSELEPVFGDRDFMETLRLEPYFEYAASQVPESAAFYAALLSETRAISSTLVHGDYSPKNVLVHNDQLILLDHEVIHFGDPGFDLGFSLTHFLSKAHHLPERRADFAGAAKHYWDRYEQTVGFADWTIGLEARAVRHTLCILLARVAGRSPLEYLSPDERSRQRAVVLALMLYPPETVHDLVDRFVGSL